MVLPLPEGEGRGEGETSAAVQAINVPKMVELSRCIPPRTLSFVLRISCFFRALAFGFRHYFPHSAFRT